MTTLINYAWPGNVRELEHAIERAVILAVGARITPAELPDELRAKRTGKRRSGSLDVRRNERELIEEALQRYRGNRRRAAEALNMSSVTLWRKIRRYALDTDDGPAAR